MEIRFKNHIVISGMHRSGTTFVGQMLSQEQSVVSLHEPFNREYGIDDIAVVYPDNLDEQLSKTISDIRQLKFKSIRQAPSDHFTKAIARRLLGGKTNIDKAKAKLKLLMGREITSLLIKDPFLILLTKELGEKFDMRSVVTIRHPVAIWNSIKRMNWSFDYTNFASEKFSLDVIGKDRAKLNQLTEVEKFAYLYRALYTTTLRNLEKSGCILLVRHEDLCLDPIKYFDRIADHLSIQLSEKTIKNINFHTSRNDAKIKQDKLHNLSRDSSQLAWSWCSLPPNDDEKIIQSICTPLVERIYGFWSPTRD